MATLKSDFLKKKNTGEFSEIVMGDIKLMPNKIRKVSRGYLSSFLSYRETPSGGQNLPPTRSHANLTIFSAGTERLTLWRELGLQKPPCYHQKLPTYFDGTNGVRFTSM